MSKRRHSRQNVQYDSIDKLSATKDDWKIRVRVSRLWDVTFNEQDVSSTEMVLLDEKGDYIHAIIKKNIVAQFRPLLNEGRVYMIKKFAVVENRENFRVVSDCKNMIHFYGTTSVQNLEIEDEIIQRHRFDLLDYSSLETRKGKTYILTDVIGLIIGESQPRKSNNALKIAVELQDLRLNKARVNIWGHLVESYNKDKALLGDEVLIGTLFLSTSKSSRIYINPEIPEVAAYKERFGSDKKALELRTRVTEKFAEEEMNRDKKNIAEILEEAKKKNPKVRTFFCCATIKKVLETNGWFYVSCNGCKRKVIPSCSNFRCDKCEKTVEYPVNRYRVELQVEDTFGETIFVAFDQVMEKIIGTPAEDIQISNDNEEEEENDNSLPAAIKNIVGKSFLFLIKVDAFNIRLATQSFTAIKVMDEDNKDQDFTAKANPKSRVDEEQCGGDEPTTGDEPSSGDDTAQCTPKNGAPSRPFALLKRKRSDIQYDSEGS